eukprot:3134032-Prymnesium_polylepis.1
MATRAALMTSTHDGVERAARVKPERRPGLEGRPGLDSGARHICPVAVPASRKSLGVTSTRSFV